MKSKTVWESANYKLKVEFIDENGDGPGVRLSLLTFCCKRLVALRDKPAQRRDHAQPHDPSGARIL
jgi:hypothetical protein